MADGDGANETALLGSRQESNPNINDQSTYLLTPLVWTRLLGISKVSPIIVELFIFFLFCGNAVSDGHWTMHSAHTAHIKNSVIFNQFFLTVCGAGAFCSNLSWHCLLLNDASCPIYKFTVEPNQSTTIFRLYLISNALSSADKWQNSVITDVLSHSLRFVYFVFNESLFRAHANVMLWCRKENIMVRAMRPIGVRCSVLQLAVCFSFISLDSFPAIRRVQKIKLQIRYVQM